MSAVRCPLSLKTVRFSVKDSAKNTFIKICPPKALPRRRYKYNKIFAINEKHSKMGYCTHKKARYDQRANLYYSILFNNSSMSALDLMR